MRHIHKEKDSESHCEENQVERKETHENIYMFKAVFANEIPNLLRMIIFISFRLFSSFLSFSLFISLLCSFIGITAFSSLKQFGVFTGNLGT